MKLTKNELQKALDALTAANRRAHKARNKIFAHCEAVYGVTPGDVSNDSFIDACDNGCGLPAGMSADEFDRSMRQAINLNGIGPR